MTPPPHNLILDLREQIIRELFTTTHGWVARFDFDRNPALSTCDKSIPETPARFSVENECTTQTDYGPVYFRDGMLVLLNPDRVNLTPTVDESMSLALFLLSKLLLLLLLLLCVYVILAIQLMLLSGCHFLTQALKKKREKTSILAL